MKKWMTGTVFIAFLYLLRFPEAAAVHARDGLLLWYHSVIPVLFPFMLLCSIVIKTGLLSSLPTLLTRPLCFLFGCSEYGAFAVITGFLCGFPMGAKITSELQKNAHISSDEAKFLYGFVNNLSPGFIISFLAAGQMKQPGFGILFLINILGASFLYGLLTSIPMRSKRNRRTVSDPVSGDTMYSGIESSSAPASADTVLSKKKNLFAIIDDCIYDSICSTLRLGGYIVIFSVLSGAVMLLPNASQMPWKFVIANIEVTNGIGMLCSSQLPFSVRYYAVNAVAAFGGLSAAAQTAGISELNPSLFLHYIKSRVMITLLSLILSFCSLFFFRFFL